MTEAEAKATLAAETAEAEAKALAEAEDKATLEAEAGEAEAKALPEAEEKAKLEADEAEASVLTDSEARWTRELSQGKFIHFFKIYLNLDMKNENFEICFIA